jgi:hypothetical protein
MTTIDNSRLTMAADYIREHGWTQGTMKDATDRLHIHFATVRLHLFTATGRLQSWRDFSGR